MKKQRHIQTHVLLTLVGLSCGLLLAVVLVFNLSIRSYIRSRVSQQLSTVSDSASQTWQGDMRERKGRFDEHPDRVTGTRGSAVVLDGEGRLLAVLHGDESVGGELAACFAGKKLSGDIPYRIIKLESGTYAVSVREDPFVRENYLLSYVDMTALTAFTRRVNTMLAVIILAAIGLSVFLSRSFARTLSKPVRELTDFAVQIGGGKLETRQMQFEDVEFDQLAGSMNHMVTELKDAKQKQETFFQNVSHELRTPLTSIRGNAEGIVCGIMEPKAAGRVILSESDKLGGLVEELLYLSRVGRSVPTDTARPLDLREVLSLCAFEQRTEAEGKGLTISYVFDDDPVMCAIREQDAQRLFGNLLSNAIRYARKEIRLTCRREDDASFVSVADDGPGVSAEDLPHVFERFYKGAGGKHGIGLSIARSVAESYHGSIGVKNKDGAVFEVRLPLA